MLNCLKQTIKKLIITILALEATIIRILFFAPRQAIILTDPLSTRVDEKKTTAQYKEAIKVVDKAIKNDSGLTESVRDELEKLKSKMSNVEKEAVQLAQDEFIVKKYQEIRQCMYGDGPSETDSHTFYHNIPFMYSKSRLKSNLTPAEYASLLPEEEDVSSFPSSQEILKETKTTSSLDKEVPKKSGTDFFSSKEILKETDTNPFLNDYLPSTHYRKILKMNRVYKEPAVNKVEHTSVAANKTTEILVQTAENIPETTFYFYLIVFGVVGFSVCFLVFLHTPNNVLNKIKIYFKL